MTYSPTSDRILLVDPDAASRDTIAELIRSRGYEVDGVDDGSAALERIGKRPPRLILTKLDLPGMGGVELTKELRTRKCSVPVLVITSFESVVGALATRRAGADGFVHEPTDPESLFQAVDDALLPARPRTNAASWWNESRSSASMQDVERAACRLAASDAVVLLRGEAGVGKEQTARVIHALGPRASGPFVILRCAGLAEARLEAELFGVETRRGAREQRQGALDRAAGGTLLIEDISTLSLATQARLLELLQEGAYRRVGGADAHALRARVLVSTDHDLTVDVSDGSFRQDLLYRLSVASICVPSLRDRADDVVRLAEALLRQHASETHAALEGFTEAACAKLRAHTWPGNVRELEHAVSRAVLLCESSRIDACDLHLELDPASADPIRVPGATLAEIERHAILTALDATGGSTTKAAQLLDISIRTIQYRLHQYGISRSK